MDREQRELKQFLEQQLQWTIEQARILDEIHMHLHEMKEIAEYALKHELTQEEIKQLNGQLHDLKDVVHSLEKQLRSVVH